jgi:hypothetical protein
METFHELFGSLLGFVYHCFDRIVIQGRHHRVEAYLRSAAHINVRNKRGFFSNHRDTYDRGLVSLLLGDYTPLAWRTASATVSSKESTKLASPLNGMN